MALADAEPIPPAFLCPITRELMHSPVMCSDGHTYERVAIVRWLADHDTSPLTNVVLPTKVLTANHALHRAIQDHALRRAFLDSPLLRYVSFRDSEQSLSELVHMRLKEITGKLEAVYPDSEDMEVLTMLKRVHASQSKAGDSFAEIITALEKHNSQASLQCNKDQLLNVVCAAVLALETQREGEVQRVGIISEASARIAELEVTLLELGEDRTQEMRLLRDESLRKVKALEELVDVSASARGALASFQYMCSCLSQIYPEASLPPKLVQSSTTVLERSMARGTARFAQELVLADVECSTILSRHATKQSIKVDLLSSRLDCALTRLKAMQAEHDAADAWTKSTHGVATTAHTTAHTRTKPIHGVDGDVCATLTTVVEKPEVTRRPKFMRNMRETMRQMKKVADDAAVLLDSLGRVMARNSEISLECQDTRLLLVFLVDTTRSQYANAAAIADKARVSGPMPGGRQAKALKAKQSRTPNGPPNPKKLPYPRKYVRHSVRGAVHCK